jgi:hypothetical protein
MFCRVLKDITENPGTYESINDEEEENKSIDNSKDGASSNFEEIDFVPQFQRVSISGDDNTGVCQSRFYV